MMEIDTGKVYSLRPNEYDTVVLEMISRAHPEIPDVAGLIRKALREYQIARSDGGTKAKVSEMAGVLKELVGLVKVVSGDINYVKAKIDTCDSVED